MSSFWIRILAGLLILAAAGCGKLPKPFEPGARDRNNPLLRLQDSPGVVVAPVYDAPSDISAPVAERVAEALRRQDIPATAAGVLNSGNLLEGWYRLENSGNGLAAIIIEWRLSDKAGAELLFFESRVPLPIAALTEDMAPRIDQIATSIAPRVARTMIGEQTAALDITGPTLAIGDISGAPGDGNAALHRAFTAVLRRTELQIVPSANAAIAKLDGVVQVKPASDKEDQVRLVWTIRDSDQKTVAVFKQENRVPKDRLARRWGSMAFNIALALRGQIVDTIQRLETSTSGGLALPPALK